MNARWAACACSLIACSLAIPACRGPHAQEPLIAEPPQAPAPMLTTVDSGVEIHWWITSDADHRVGARLARMLEPALPQDPALRSLWRSAGLRLVRAPIRDMISLERDLPASHMRRHQWVGWATRWTEIFRGRRAGGRAPLIVEGRRISLPMGTLRILMRAWPGPDPQDHTRAIVRLELAFQLHLSEPAAARSLLEPPTFTPLEEEGPVFRSLTLETSLEDGYIYIITAEAPDIDWQASEDPDEEIPDDATPSKQAGASTRATGSGGDPFGPPVSSALTIGEAMMTASGSESQIGSAKVLLIILPRAPDRYRLIPQRQSDQ